ncbi:MAG: hypothetical protein ABI177_05520 [Edaphobacter sp.]
MPTTLKRNAVIVLGLAGLFCWSFLFAKHDPALRNVIPFGDDPYDAVGSLGVIVGVLVALLSSLRAFRRCRETPSVAQLGYLIRSQQAVVLAVFLTLAVDAVAMARHASMWTGAGTRNRLLVLLGVLTLVTAAVQWLLRAAQKRVGGSATARWGVPASVTLLAIAVLAGYPEHLVGRTSTHLLTVVVADLLLLAPMRLLLNAIVPYEPGGEQVAKPATVGKWSTAGQRWAIALLGGIGIGAAAFLAEMSDGGSTPPLGRLVLVASVYVALGLAGILAAYAFLGRPLGLGPQS